MSTSNQYSLPFPVKPAFRHAADLKAAAAGTAVADKAGTPARRAQSVAAAEAQEEATPADRASLLLPEYGAVGDVEFGEQQYPQEEYPDMGGMDMDMQQQQPFGDFDEGVAQQMGRSSGASFDGRGSLGGSSQDHSFNPATNSDRESFRRPQRVAMNKNSVSESICMALEQQIPASGEGGNKSQHQQQAASDSSGLNERTRAVMAVLQQQFAQQVSISFDEVTSGVTKRAAASCFLEVLQLKTRGFLEATQSEPFGDITLMPVRSAIRV